MSNSFDENKNPLKKRDTAKKMDNPDLLETENESLFEKHEDMQTVDSLPVEELNDKVKDERRKDHTKDTSASERKYNP